MSDQKDSQIPVRSFWDGTTDSVHSGRYAAHTRLTHVLRDIEGDGYLEQAQWIDARKHIPINKINTAANTPCYLIRA